MYHSHSYVLFSWCENIFTFFCPSSQTVTNSWLVARKVAEASKEYLIQELGLLVLLSSAWYLVLEEKD